MTTPSPRRARRWFVWLGFGITVVVIGAAYRSWQLDCRISDWHEGALARNIGAFPSSEFLLPGLPIPGTSSQLNCPFLERRRFLIRVEDSKAVEVALSLPECPVQVVVFPGLNLDDNDRQRLRDHFGADNVRG